jgi:hypothetical protein
MELVFLGRRFHLGGGFVFGFQVGLGFCDCFFRVWWRLRVFGGHQREEWSFVFAKCKLVLGLGEGNRSLLCWTTKRWVFVFVHIVVLYF